MRAIDWRWRFTLAAAQSTGEDELHRAIAHFDAACSRVRDGCAVATVARELHEHLHRLVPDAASHQHLFALAWNGMSVASCDAHARSLPPGGIAELQTRTSIHIQQPDGELVRHVAAEQVQSFFQHAHDIVGIIGSTGEVASISDTVARVLGHNPHEIAGVSIDCLAPIIGKACVCEIARVLSSPSGTTSTLVTRAIHADSSMRWIEIHLINQVDNPAVRGVVFRARDITRYKHVEHELERMAFFDTLTGLPNRAKFREALDLAMRQPVADGAQVAVIFLDLDRFKMVNDRFGHDAGDSCLIAVSERIRESLESDQMVARLAGDEFAVLLRNTSHDAALHMANRILEALMLPFESNNRFINVEASAGVALRSRECATSTALLRAADVALYHGKVHSGGGMATMFQPEMARLATHRAEMKRALQSALDRHEFVPYFQPEIDLVTGKPASLELLMRWQREDGTVEKPKAFLEIARDMGIIIPMTLDILEQASRQLTAWNTDHLTTDPLPMSFNVTRREIAQPHYPQRVREILERSGCDPGLVSIEIDDHILHESTPELDRFVRATHCVGLGIVVDGYGGSHASLARLPGVKPNRLKFSRSAAGVHPSPAVDKAILDLVTTVAADQAIPVTVVGPATPQLLASARDAGCQLAQSDYLAPALPARDIPSIIGSEFRLQVP